MAAKPDLEEPIGTLTPHAVLHVLGPTDEDGFQRCLRCDVMVVGTYKVGQFLLVDGENQTAVGRRQMDRIRRYACAYPARWQPNN